MLGAAVDIKQTLRAAHDLKSTSAALGALVLAEAAARIEHLAQTGTSTTQAQLNALAGEFTRVRDALAAIHE